MNNLSEKKIAIFGGTFNPVHIGHLLTGFDILEKLNYDYIIYIPANIPAHKKISDYIEPVHRVEMLKLAIKGIDPFILSDIEIKNGGISYTIDTVKELTDKLEYKNRFGIIIGEDLSENIETWKDIDKLVEISDIICLSRNVKVDCRSKIKMKKINNRIVDISSTEIRERIKMNLPIDFFVPDIVKEYIYHNKLYRD